MRTTIDLDEDVARAVRSLAHQRSQTLGKTVSELVRRGLGGNRVTPSRDGFPTFAVPSDARPITMEDVKKDEDAS